MIGAYPAPFARGGDICGTQTGVCYVPVGIQHKGVWPLCRKTTKVKYVHEKTVSEQNGFKSDGRETVWPRADHGRRCLARLQKTWQAHPDAVGPAPLIDLSLICFSIPKVRVNKTASATVCICMIRTAHADSTCDGGGATGAVKAGRLRPVHMRPGEDLKDRANLSSSLLSLNLHAII